MKYRASLFVDFLVKMRVTRGSSVSSVKCNHTIDAVRMIAFTWREESRNSLGSVERYWHYLDAFCRNSVLQKVTRLVSLLSEKVESYIDYLYSAFQLSLPGADILW